MNSDLLTMIGNVGFPIAVSVYLLVRLEGKLESLTTCIHELATVITTMDRCGGEK